METKYNRWLILGATIIVNVCIGSQYAWSVFAMPLGNLFGWSGPVLALAFTLTFITGPIVMTAGGMLQDHKGAKFNIVIGGILFGVGMFFTGFISSPEMLYFTFSLIAGVGGGIVYAGNVANTNKFFPDKRGLAVGLAAAGYGSGAMIAAPIASFLIMNNGVLDTFKIFGAVFLVVILVCSLIIKAAPTGYRPEGWQPPVAANAVSPALIDKNWRQMLQDPRWYVMACMFAIAALSGLMILAHASSIGQTMFKLSPQIAAFYVSLIAVFNMAGRIIFGFVSDKIGRPNTLAIMFTISACMLFLLTNAASYVGFAAAGAGIGACFGGAQAIFPSLVAENYGTKNVGVNYGITFVAFGVAAYYGPMIAANVAKANNGIYTQAFWFAMVLNVIGLVITFGYKMLDKRSKLLSTNHIAR
ncbi:OFA family MFS transporter [Sporomusa sp. KB1]|jgi:OFA family oxalate/formate antiporter-like MFS transporter|uniref:L-lactate MFS transporter n=1 Tax=Sporomusa sp. KB1 TaxID=943346 RepID=UPI0011A32862|nr:OFA family MFS transporter [Sporomusa sp. KB1]TWH51788.1 OFA family oxalate/formate antiporter-like MFS transporter [Sporomusa sp. KB1]